MRDSFQWSGCSETVAIYPIFMMAHSQNFTGKCIHLCKTFATVNVLGTVCFKNSGICNCYNTMSLFEMEQTVVRNTLLKGTVSHDCHAAHHWKRHNQQTLSVH